MAKKNRVYIGGDTPIYGPDGQPIQEGNGVRYIKTGNPDINIEESLQKILAQQEQARKNKNWEALGKLQEQQKVLEEQKKLQDQRDRFNNINNIIKQHNQDIDNNTYLLMSLDSIAKYKDKMSQDHDGKEYEKLLKTIQQNVDQDKKYYETKENLTKKDIVGQVALKKYFGKDISRAWNTDSKEYALGGVGKFIDVIYSAVEDSAQGIAATAGSLAMYAYHNTSQYLGGEGLETLKEYEKNEENKRVYTDSYIAKHLKILKEEERRVNEELRKQQSKNSYNNLDNSYGEGDAFTALMQSGGPLALKASKLRQRILDLENYRTGNADGFSMGIVRGAEDILGGVMTGISHLTALDTVSDTSFTGEALDRADTMLNYSDKTLNLYEGNELATLGRGVGSSLAFMAGMGVIGGATGLGAGVSKLTSLGKNIITSGGLSQSMRTASQAALQAIDSTIAKGGLRLLAKDVAMHSMNRIGQIAGMSALLPSTYSIAKDRLIDDNNQVVVDPITGAYEILLGETAKLNFVNKAENEMQMFQNKIEAIKKNPNISNSEKEKLIEELQVKITSLQDQVEQIGEIKEDTSVLKALGYGMVENMTEVFAERYVGDVAEWAWKGTKGYMGKAIKAASQNKVGKALGTILEKTGLRKVGGVLDEVQNAGVELAKSHNPNILPKDNVLGAFYDSAIKRGIGKNRVLHNIPGEMLEEIFVQASYNPFGREGEWQEKLSHLADPDFYKDILLQTLTIGGLTGAVGMASNPRHTLAMMTDRQYAKNYLDQVDNVEFMQDLLKEVQLTGKISQENLLKMAGRGVYSSDDWMSTINEAEASGDTALSDIYTKRFLRNLMWQSVTTGNVDEAHHIFRAIRQDTNNLPDSFKRTIDEFWQQEKGVLENTSRKYGNLPNFTDILEREYNLIDIKNSKENYGKLVEESKVEFDKTLSALQAKNLFKNFKILSSEEQEHLRKTDPGALGRYKANLNKFLKRLKGTDAANYVEYLAAMKELDILEQKNINSINDLTSEEYQKGLRDSYIHFKIGALNSIEEYNKFRESLSTAQRKQFQDILELKAQSLKEQEKEKQISDTYSDKKDNPEDIEDTEEIPDNPEEDAELDKMFENFRNSGKSIEDTELTFAPALDGSSPNTQGNPLMDRLTIMYNRSKSEGGNTSKNFLKALHTALGTDSFFVNRHLFKDFYEKLAGKEYSEQEYNAALAEIQIEISEDKKGLQDLMGTTPTQANNLTSQVVEELAKNNTEEVFDSKTQTVKRVGSVDPNTTSIVAEKPDILTVEYEVIEEQVEIEKEDGTKTTKIQKSIKNKAEKLIDALKVSNFLNTDITYEGATFKARPISEEEYEEHTVTIYVDNKETGKVEPQYITFKEWLEKNPHVKKGSKEFIEKIPIVVETSEGDFVFKIKETDWYNPTNIQGIEEDSLNEFISNHRISNFADRKKIFEKGSMPLTITKVKPGAVIRTLDGRRIPLSQANPGNKRIVVVKGGKFSDHKGPIEDINITNKTPFKDGTVMELREVGKNEYQAFPLNPSSTQGGNSVLGDTVFNNIKMAVQASIYINAQKKLQQLNSKKQSNQEDPNLDKEIEKTQQVITLLEKKGMSLSKANQIVDIINQGLDYGDIVNDLGSYINKFVRVSSDTKGLEDNSGIPEGTPIINWFGGDDMTFNITLKSPDGQVKYDTFVDKSGDKISRPKTTGTSLDPNKAGSLNPQGVSIILSMFEGENPPFRKAMINTDVNMLGLNRPMHEITPDGSVKTLETTYEDYLADTYHTNVLTAQIPTKDGGVKTVTTVHPVVNYKIGDSKDVSTPMVNTLTNFAPKGDPNPKIDSDKTDVGNKDKTSTEEKNEKKDPLKEKISEELSTFQKSKTLLKELQGSTDPVIAELFGDMRIFQSKAGLTHSAVLLTQEDQDKIEQREDFIEGLDINQKQQLINSLYGSIIRNYLAKRKNPVENKIDVELLNEEINNIIENEINSLREKEEKRLQWLEENGYADHPLAESLRNKLQVIKNINDVKEALTNEKSALRKKLEKALNTNINDNEEFSEETEIEDSMEGEEQNYSKSSQEKDIKSNLSSRLKIFFSDIPKIDTSTQGVAQNFFGLPEYYTAEEVFNQMLANMSNIPSSWEMFMNTLATKKHGNPVLTAIYEKLQNIPKELQNEIMYKFVHNKLKMLTVKIDNDIASVLEENQGTSTFRVIRGWLSNIENMEDPIVILDDENRKVYDRQHIRNILKNLENTIKEAEKKYRAALKYTHDKSKVSVRNYLTPESLQTILGEFGIQMDLVTTRVILDQYQDRIFSAKSPLKILQKVYGDIVNRKDMSFDLPNHRKLFSNIHNNLAEIQAKVSGSIFSGSFRVNGKNIQEAILPLLSKQLVTELKDPNSDLFKRLQQNPYTANSYFLELLKNSPEFREVYNIDFQSINSISKENVDSDKAKLNEVSDGDKEISILNLFQNTERNLSYRVGKNKGIRIRLGRQPNMTISDKDNMLLHLMPLLDLVYDVSNPYKSNIVMDTEGNLSLSDEVMDFALEEIFIAEFNRIVHAFTQDTNINNYDDAARRFNGFVDFNRLQDESGNNILDVISTLVKKGQQNSPAMEKARAEFKEKAKEVFSKYLNQEVNDKLAQWDSLGMQVESKKNTKGEDVEVLPKFHNRVYLKSKAPNTDGETQRRVAALDYVLNYTLGNQNQNKMLNGDLALFAPNVNKVLDTDTKKKLEKAKDSFERSSIINEFFNNNPAAEKKFNELIGENQLKRMAMMIAPGNILADSYNDKYIQIFVNDVERASSNLPFYIKSLYGNVSEEAEKQSEIINKAYDKIDELLEQEQTEEVKEEITNLEETIQKNKDKLSKAYPKIKPFLNITGTDAQEYTTWQEHLDIIFRQGKLSTKKKAILQSAYEKLSRNEEVNEEELALIMQPIKPIYAGPTGTAEGNSLNEIKGVNRIVYIKSSSFPLLPQLTKNTKLDKVRQTMEEVQKRHKKNVRLSYQSANKVGSINTKLTMNDIYSGKIEELIGDNNEGIVGTSMLEMNRMNFKIQQEVPYKTEKYSKKDSEDYVKMSTQMWKILMSGGINTIQDKVFDSTQIDKSIIKQFNEHLKKYNGDLKLLIDEEQTKINGFQLDAIKTFIENTIFDKKREQLETDLGFKTSEDSYTEEEREKILVKIAKIIEEELDTRDYPPGLRDSIELVRDEYERVNFALPLWLNENFDKIDSLIQSIVTNRVMKIELPGNSLVSTSSEGFQKVGFDKLDKETKQGIIWLDPNRTGDLKATTFENGKLKESEVLIQPKFRKKVLNKKTGKYETKLIDLREKNEDGSWKYLNEENGVFSLKEDMIDPDLLSNFSFRIPVSSHQSGAIIKVVGFLPQASADMIVLPKEHTTLLGEDYDIDKRYLYKNHYVVDEEGKIQRLTSDNKHLKIKEEEETTDKSKSKIKDEVENLLLENSLVNLYKSVYSSESQEVQNKINKVLSMEVAEDTSKLIKERLNSSNDSTERIFSIYSEKYQREQMNSGTSGKIGTALHSLAVVAQAQYERFGGVIAGEPLVIGRLSSNGWVGKPETIQPNGKQIDNPRTRADVHAENQNSAVDNIKAQIMFWRNENKYTIDALIQATNRGFDQDYLTLPDGSQVKVSVPSLLLGQPILRIFSDIKSKYDGISNNKYVTDTNIYKEVITTFINTLNTIDTNTKDSILDLIESAKTPQDFEKLLNPLLGSENSLTTEVLYDQLDGNKASLQAQLKVLTTFITLNEEAKYLKKFRKFSNKKDLPKSSIEVESLVRDFGSVLKDLYMTVSMGGNLKDHPAKVMMDLEDENLQKIFTMNELEFENFLNSEKYLHLWVPVSSESKSIKNAILTSRKMSKVLYGDSLIKLKEAYQRYLDSLGIEESSLSEYSRNQLVYKLQNGLRDMAMSNAATGLFNGTVEEERRRLFFDDPKTGHISLAHYMQKLKANPQFGVLFENVEFLKPFVMDSIDSTGKKPSILKYIPLSRSSQSETAQYEDFMLLVGDNKTVLPSFNGVVMTPQKLAQELAIYAMLAPQEGGAIGFRRVINNKYLTAMGFNFYQNINNSIDDFKFVEQYISQNYKSLPVFSNTGAMKFVEGGYYDTKNKEIKAKVKSAFTISRENFTGDFIIVEDKGQKILYKKNYRESSLEESYFERVEPLQKEFGYHSYDNTGKDTFIDLLNKEAINSESILEEMRNSKEESNKDQANKVQVFKNLSKKLEIIKGRAGIVEKQKTESTQVEIKVEPQKEVQEKSKEEPKGPFRSVESRIKNQSVKTVLKEIISTNPSNRAVIEKLIQAAELEDIGIVFEEIKSNPNSPAAYDSTRNVIIFNKLANQEASAKHFDRVLVEEVIHAFTVRELQKYFNGLDTENPAIKENSVELPSHIKKLYNLYVLAKKNITPTTELQKYYLKNLKEFIAGVFIDPELIDILDKTFVEDSKAGSKSLWKKFIEAISSVLENLTGKKTFSSVVREEVLEFLEENRKIKQGFKPSIKKDNPTPTFRVVPIKKTVYHNDPNLTQNQNASIQTAINSVDKAEPLFENSDFNKGKLLGHDIHAFFLGQDIDSESKNKIFRSIIGQMYRQGKVFAVHTDNNKRTNLEKEFIKYFLRISEDNKIETLIKKDLGGKAYITLIKPTENTEETIKKELKGKVIPTKDTTDNLNKDRLINEIKKLNLDSDLSSNNLLSLLEENKLVEKTCI